MAAVHRQLDWTRPAEAHCARQSFVVARRLLLASTAAVPAASTQPAPVSVRGDRGVYRVAATFATPQPIAVALAVLTDYEQIPALHARRPQQPRPRARRRPRRRRAGSGGALDVLLQAGPPGARGAGSAGEHPLPRSLRARASSATKGTWTLREQDGHAVIGYELLAEPGFDVPEFMLTRLLKRDAGTDDRAAAGRDRGARRGRGRPAVAIRRPFRTRYAAGSAGRILDAIADLVAVEAEQRGGARLVVAGPSRAWTTRLFSSSSRSTPSAGSAMPCAACRRAARTGKSRARATAPRPAASPARRRCGPRGCCRASRRGAARAPPPPTRRARLAELAVEQVDVEGDQRRHVVEARSDGSPIGSTFSR